MVAIVESRECCSKHWPWSDSQRGPMETRDTACNHCSCGQPTCSGTWGNQSCWSPSSVRERKQALTFRNSTPENHASKAPSEPCGSWVRQDKNYKQCNQSPIAIQISTISLIQQSIQQNLSRHSGSSSDGPFAFVSNHAVLLYYIYITEHFFPI